MNAVLDYDFRSSIMTIPAGGMRTTVSVQSIDDSVVEPKKETFLLVLTSVDSNPLPFLPTSATGTIIDNDVTSPLSVLKFQFEFSHLVEANVQFTASRDP